VDVGIDAACGEDHPFARDDFGAAANHDVYARLDVGVARLADGSDAAIFEANVGLHDAPVIDNQRVGDDGIGDFGGDALALAHAVADDLAAAKFHFFAVSGVVVFDLNPQLGIGQAHAVAGGRAEHLGVSVARNGGTHERTSFFAASSGPMTSPRNP